MKQKNIYLLQKEKHEKIINDFPVFYAFSNEQLEEGLKKLNTIKEEILSIGYGGFIKKSDKKAYSKIWESINKETEKSLKDELYLYAAFRYELANHEFCITYDYTDTLDLFNLKEDTLTEKQEEILNKAREDYLNNCENE
jgi:hypothetical protein